MYTKSTNTSAGGGSDDSDGSGEFSDSASESGGRAMDDDCFTTDWELEEVGMKKRWLKVDKDIRESLLKKQKTSGSSSSMKEVIIIYTSDITSLAHPI